MKKSSSDTQDKQQSHAQQDDFSAEELQAKVEELETALQAAQDALIQAQEGERRALADYQNVVRRSQEEKIKIMKLAGRDVVSALLLPLDHLNLAKEQLKDQGLNMIHQQFLQALQSQGVQEVEALGHPFDEAKMEVIDKRPVNDPVQHNIVIAVTQRGYIMNGEVIRYAKVVVGVPEPAQAASEDREQTHNS